MDPLNCCTSIMMYETKQILRYNNIPMLTLSVFYPKVYLCNYPYAQNNINSQIQVQVSDFLRYASINLYKQAVETYKQSQENGFPFLRYEASLQYNITYNQNCYLSLYADQYEFTSGAHGNTVRMSNTWGIMDGRSIPLSDFFPAGQDYRRSLINQITEQAKEKVRQNPGSFFEDYPALIAEYFNEEHFYLKSSGLAIYYQQYEIAPYSTGIVVFTIPYMAPSY
ncbi:MAG: DUF3298 and DUF4163 domain-containing protein [Clostridiales bacterium]